MDKKYYVVWAGRVPGIYQTWEQCKEQFMGYQGRPIFKAYPTLEAARKAYNSAPSKRRAMETLPIGNEIQKMLDRYKPNE